MPPPGAARDIFDFLWGNATFASRGFRNSPLEVLIGPETEASGVGTRPVRVESARDVGRTWEGRLNVSGVASVRSFVRTGARAVALVLALCSEGFAQADPATLTFGQAVEVKTVRMAPGTDGQPAYTELGVRRATVEELERIALSDEDGDGIPGIRDACPLRPDCGRADGSFAELGPPEFKSDVMSGILIRFADAEELGDTILAQNAGQDPPLYPPDQLIAISVAAGFPTTTTQKWINLYSCSKEARERCRTDCRSRCPKPPPGKGGTAGETYGRCISACEEECRRFRKCSEGGDR